MQELGEEHLETAKLVLQYFKGNSGQGILLQSDSILKIVAYCDSEWGAYPITRKSFTGYFVTLGGSPIFWRTKKQTTVSRSSVEKEHRAMATVISDQIWIRSFLASIRVFVKIPMQLFCDNQAALHIAKNSIFHVRTKHIEIDCHFILEQLLSAELITGYVPSKKQVADIFTKALGKQQILFLRSNLGIFNPDAPT